MHKYGIVLINHIHFNIKLLVGIFISFAMVFTSRLLEKINEDLKLSIFHGIFYYLIAMIKNKRTANDRVVYLRHAFMVLIVF